MLDAVGVHMASGGVQRAGLRNASLGQEREGGLALFGVAIWVACFHGAILTRVSVRYRELCHNQAI